MNHQAGSSSHEVQVAIYDLSQGMARSLSAQFLGPQYTIDAIPHTGVIVYGKDYFFGGGIQCEDPTALRRMTGILPIQILTVGRTHVTRTEFESWCRRKMDSGEFSMASYDLLTHNCNDFCEAALKDGLKLSQGIPQWIHDVPRRFLSSPMGQIVRPMLENMQLGNVSGAQTMTSSASFSSAAPSLASANPWAQTHNNNTSSDDTKSPSQSESARNAVEPNKSSTTLATNNPWANVAVPTPAPADKSSTTPSFDILNEHKMPLLANETKTVYLCVEKLIPLANGDEEATHLRVLGEKLAKGLTITPSPQITAASSFLLRCLETNQKTTFALMIVRLMALTNAESCLPCIEWITKEIHSEAGVLQSPASRAMSWLTLSNIFAKASSVLSEQWEALIETSIRDINPESQARVEVRQASCAFLYNAVLVPSMQLDVNADLSELHVSILCAAIDSFETEQDETVRLRRLLGVARIVSPVPSNDDGGMKVLRQEAAAQLLVDLGFLDSLENFALVHTGTKSGKLARELLRLCLE